MHRLKPLVCELQQQTRFPNTCKPKQNPKLKTCCSNPYTSNWERKPNSPHKRNLLILKNPFQPQKIAKFQACLCFFCSSSEANRNKGKEMNLCRRWWCTWRDSRKTFLKRCRVGRWRWWRWRGWSSVSSQRFSDTSPKILLLRPKAKSRKGKREKIIFKKPPEKTKWRTR